MKNILLVGNPNVGKTAILNKLAGSSYNIGNWSGVTVTRQEGILKTDKENFHLLDLPGVYSLIPCSEDEAISIQEIFTSNYDLILNIIDLNNLHQNLMLTAELLELGVPMIGVLNFSDEFEKNYDLDITKLQDQLGIPMIMTSARTGQGFDELKHMVSLTENYSSWVSPLRIVNIQEYKDIVKVLPTAEARYTLAGIAPHIDSNVVYTYLSLSHPTLVRRFNLDPKELIQIANDHNLPNYLDALMQKKELIIDKNPVVAKDPQTTPVDLGRSIDNWLLHPIFGYGFFAVIMSVLFTMVFNAANPFIDFIDWLIGEKITLYAEILLEDVNPTLYSFIIDGLIGGVGSVLTFVPLIFILYIFLAVLEESGYLARVAILLEKPFSKIGLSGKSFFPMLLGFGCTVPAIYGTRVLETTSLRRLTAIVSSLMSCGARLPVYALFIAAFFPDNGGMILLSLYLVGIFLALVLSFVLSRFPAFSSESTCFVMVLPNYRWPSIKVITQKAMHHASGYIKNAGGIILGVLMLIWVFSYFPSEGDVNESYIAKMGQTIQPIFEPLGFGDRWEPVVSIIPSLVAKEAVVGFFGQVLAGEEDEEEGEEEIELNVSDELLEIGETFVDTVKDSLLGIVTWDFMEQFGTPDEEELEEEGGSGIVARLHSIWEDDENAPKKAYSFMLFILLTLPCAAAMGALFQELHAKYFFFAVALYLLLPFVGSLIYYQLAILF